MRQVRIRVQRTLANERHIFVRSGHKKTRRCELARLVRKMAARAAGRGSAKDAKEQDRCNTARRICVSGAHVQRGATQGRAAKRDSPDIKHRKIEHLHRATQEHEREYLAVVWGLLRQADAEAFLVRKRLNGSPFLLRNARRELLREAKALVDVNVDV